MIWQTEVDGVPTLLAPSSAGPMAAGLMFRVGRADETLATSGMTHLVEHLALHRHGLTDYHYNGTTAPVFTHFHMQGSETDVAAYMTSVCDGLANLPLDRLETEKAILRTEAAGRGLSSLPMWRYGALGYGLVSYPEWGLHRLRAEDVYHWVQTWFTRDNAVLWIVGDHVPQGLRLRLPGGVRRPPPRVTSALPTTPAYFSDGDGNVIFHGVVRRRPAGSVFAGVLERELYRSLRQEGGYSYTPTASHDPRGDGYATIVALADALPDKQGAALGGFVDVLAKLRVGRVEAEDVAAVHAKAKESFAHPDYDAMRLPGCAMNLLTGQPNHSRDELERELLAVTPADIGAVAVEATASALLQVPDGARADWAGYAPAPTASESAVEGTRYGPADGSAAALVIGRDGVSLVTPHSTATVRYDQCQARLGWPDGARYLCGADGMMVRIEPTLWRMPPEAIGYLDQCVDPAVVVPMPARSPESIPQPAAQPTPAEPLAGPAAETKRTSREEKLKLAGLVGVGVALLFLSVLVRNVGSDDSTSGGSGSVVATTLRIGALCVFAVVAARFRGLNRRG